MPRNDLPPALSTSTKIVNGHKVQTQCYDDGSYSFRENDKVTRYFPDGKKQTYIKASSKEFYNETFILSVEECPDGTLRRYFPNGKISFEKLSNGTTRSWYENDKLEFEELADGTKREYYTDGKMRRAKLPDGTLLEWEHYKGAFGTSGILKCEKINNVITREWYESGQLAYAKSPNGIEIKYSRSGRIIYHATKGKEDTQKYLSKRKLSKRRTVSVLKDTRQISNHQLSLSERLRKVAIARNEEKKLLASRLKKEEEEKENKELDNLKVADASERDFYEIIEEIEKEEEQKNNNYEMLETLIKKDDNTQTINLKPSENEEKTDTPTAFVSKEEQKTVEENKQETSSDNIQQ